MAEDLFGNEIPPEDLDPEADEDQETQDADEGETTESDEAPLQAEGDVPQDAAAAQKYWQGAYTRSRQKDRERYGKMEQEYEQLKTMLTRFYQDEAYAKQVIAQRFPGQAGAGDAGRGSPARDQQAAGLTARLQQKLGDFAFLAEGLGSALEEELEARVQARLQPFEQRITQQTEQSRRQQEDELLTAMDGQYPGWEETYGAHMRELDAFLASDALTHPRFGNKYELYYRLLNPDVARIAAQRAQQEAGQRRTSLGRTGRRSMPNLDDTVRKAESSGEAFRAAARAALEELG